MTEMLTEVNSKSDILDLIRATILRDVAVLAEQFQALGAIDPLLIVIGKKTAEAFAKHERCLAEATGLTRVRWVTVPHYSAANSKAHGNNPEKYRLLVLDALRGAASPLLEG